MPFSRTSYLYRYLVFFTGLTFMALGIALTTRADLGTTPISALPYVASLGLPLSLGFFTVLMNIALVTLQIVLLRGKFPRLQYLQIPVSLLFGFLIDFWMALVPEAGGAGYAWQLGYLALGTVVLAFGVFVEVSADVVMMAGEGAVLVLSLVLRREFGGLKVAFDVTVVALGVLLSFLLFHELRGIREGTVISAVCVGFLVKGFFTLRRRFGPSGQKPGVE